MYSNSNSSQGNFGSYYQGLMCLIRSIDSNMADLGLHITLLPISRQALPSSAATCQNQLLVLQIGLCLFLYVFPVFEHLSVLFCSVLFCCSLSPPLEESRRWAWWAETPVLVDVDAKPGGSPYVHCESTGKSGGSLREGRKFAAAPLMPLIIDRQ